VQRKKTAVTDTCGPDDKTLYSEPAGEIDDETIFMPDVSGAEQVPPASIKVVESQSLKPGKSFKISGITLIGRSDNNEVYIPDKSVSRKHGEIYFESGKFYIRDLGSKNGIRVDGKRVLADGAVLKSGAQIQIAPKTILEFFCITLNEEVEADEKTRKYEF
ncbi:MAG: FHA domain-containing protein, partial [Proteobacteria bacterium]|nr:FHA domain-containing protein [Pseudomonadota bacterium]